ncbi:STXB protein, partial [Amia calva]|nr:STXB protein [Amia calva]
SCWLILDPNIVYRYLSLSEGNRKVKRTVREQQGLDHPERCDGCAQVLCTEGLTGRCFQEAEWSGKWAAIGVAYNQQLHTFHSKFNEPLCAVLWVDSTVSVC